MRKIISLLIIISILVLTIPIEAAGKKVNPRISLKRIS